MQRVKKKSSLQCEDILLLFVAIGDVAVAVGQVEQWLIVVWCTGVLGILVEANLSFVQDTVKVDPRPAVVWEDGRCKEKESRMGGKVGEEYREDGESGGGDWRS